MYLLALEILALESWAGDKKSQGETRSWGFTDKEAEGTGRPWEFGPCVQTQSSSRSVVWPDRLPAESVFQDARSVVVLPVVTTLQRLGDHVPAWQLSKLGSISDVCHGFG